MSSSPRPQPIGNPQNPHVGATVFVAQAAPQPPGWTTGEMRCNMVLTFCFGVCAMRSMGIEPFDQGRAFLALLALVGLAAKFTSNSTETNNIFRYGMVGLGFLKAASCLYKHGVDPVMTSFGMSPGQS